MRVWLLSIVLLAAPQQGPALQPEPSVAGTYQITGEGPNGPYTGTAHIIQRGNAIAIRWSSTEGALAGFGVVDGSHVAAGYGLRDDYGAAVLYRITEVALVGTWADPSGVVHSETLTKTTERVSQ